MGSLEIISTSGAEELVNLAYEPTIIKGKGGECLWHAETSRECATICKIQLKVIIIWNFTDEQNEPAKFKFAFEQKKKKETWAEFLKGVDPKKGMAHCICKHCKMVLHHPNHDSHMTPGPLTRHLDICTKYKNAQMQAQREQHNDLLDLFKNFFDTERLPTSGLMNSDYLCDQVL